MRFAYLSGIFSSFHSSNSSLFFVAKQEKYARKSNANPYRINQNSFLIVAYLVLTSSPQRSFFLIVSKKCEFSGTAMLKSKSFLLITSF